MHERTESERALVFLEIIHDLRRQQVSGLLPKDFIPDGLLALAVNGVKETLYPLPPQPEPEDEGMPIPETDRVAKNFPSPSPEKEQGDEKSGEKESKTLPEPLDGGNA